MKISRIAMVPGPTTLCRDVPDRAGERPWSQEPNEWCFDHVAQLTCGGDCGLRPAGEISETAFRNLSGLLWD